MTPIARLARLAPRSAAAGTLALLLLGATVARADQVDRSRVTLGALVDESERVVLAKVVSVDADGARLLVEKTVKGEPTGELLVPPSPDAHFVAGERALVLLRTDAQGAVRPLATSFAKVPAPDETTASLLVAAATRRLPTLGADDAALRSGLFEELGSRVARLREDAAHELLARRTLEASAADRAALGKALREGASPETLGVAERLAAKELLEPVLDAARKAEDTTTVAAAARALGAIDREGATRLFETDLRGDDAAKAGRAARLLGALGGEAAAKALGERLSDAREGVRGAALEALGTCPGAAAAAGALERVAVSPQAPGDARKAVRALARAGSGAALARIESEHPDPSLRELARKLRADPFASGD